MVIPTTPNPPTKPPASPPSAWVASLGHEGAALVDAMLLTETNNATGVPGTPRVRQRRLDERSHHTTAPVPVNSAA